MADAVANFAYSTVATAPSPASSGTSLVVQAGDGAKFPAVPFNVTIWPASAQPTTANAEIARCTARSTDTLTIVRAQEGSGARTVVVGDQIAQTVTAGTVTSLLPIYVTSTDRIINADAQESVAGLYEVGSGFVTELAGATSELVIDGGAYLPSWGPISLGGPMPLVPKQLHILGDLAIEYGDQAGFFERAGSAVIIHANKSAVPVAVEPVLHVIRQGKGVADGRLTTPLGVSGGYFQARDRTDVSKLTVTDATNASPIVITTATHPWNTGDRVRVAGVGGNTAANGYWTITKLSGTTFSLDGSTGNGAYTSGGTVHNKGYLYGLQLSVVPALGRDEAYVDDVAGLVLANESTNGSKGTDCIYIGKAPLGSFAAGDPEWLNGVSVDTNCDFAFKATSAYQVGLDFTFALTATFTTGLAVRIPNGSYIGSRDGANANDVKLIGVESNDHLTIAPTGQQVGVWTSGATPSNVSGQVFQLNSTTAGVYPELRIDYNNATAGFSDLTWYAGINRGQVMRGLCGGGSGRLYMVSNHPLTLGSNNVADVLTISGTTITVKDTINLIFPATTGSSTLPNTFVTSMDTTINTDRQLVIDDYYEIGSGFVTELAGANSKLVVTA